MARTIARISDLLVRREASTASARWIVATLVLSVVAWIGGLAILLVVANRTHVDIPRLLAVKLPLLKTNPELIFAGESRTAYGVDPVLAAQLLSQKPGYAINIGYDAGEPLAVLGAARLAPDVFAKAHVVISVAPFIFNDGVRSAGVYPQDVAARLSVGEQLVSYLPLRIGTLIRYIREAFDARLAQQERLAETAPQPANYGLTYISHTQAEGKWAARLGNHPHYANWNISGARARYETKALCDLAKLSRKLTVVIPPWAARYDRSSDPEWRERESEIVELVTRDGARCGFEVLNIPSVPDLRPENFADEMHVNATGVPIYTRYLVEQLKR
ncbi:hypothetical protein [Bradyrhizobium sp. SYSU BS000235]|uniref:hypothetical protein n=1 Tax=Bradyrhizobium sp. SYSU BS000235 TaxID=3411332 RepID=UPI003C71FAAB